jgi:hypothetical protein
LIISAVVALSLAGTLPASAQEPGRAAQTAAQKAEDETRIAQDNAHREMEDMRRQGENVRREVEQTTRRLEQGGPQFVDRLVSVIHRGPGNANRTLVVRSSNPDPKEQGNLEQDLAVMAHLLEKSVAEKLNGPPGSRTAMGIDLLFAPTPMRSLYLEGYGALFMLNVNFPLLPPAVKPEVEKEKPPVDSAWEEAKRDLYRQNLEEGRPRVVQRSSRLPHGPAEEYSEEKVNTLKTTLLEQLKNASNIRDLKAEDSITVCVFGGATTIGARPPRPGVKRGGGGGGGSDSGNLSEEERELLAAVSAPEAPARGTILTIRVKKSDVDAFVKGKLNLDEFRKRAAMATYAGEVGNAGGGIFGMAGADFPAEPPR